MHIRHLSGRGALIAATTLAGLAAAAAVATGSIPGSDGVIKACLSESGTTQIIDSEESCTGSKRTLTWNQQGPAGPAGAAGAPGISGYEMHLVSSATNPFSSKFVAPPCSDGKRPLGGGFQVDGPGAPSVTVTENQPSANGWRVRARLPNGDADWTLHGFVICASVG